MAEISYYFPNSSENYWTPFGNISFKFYYDDIYTGTPTSTDTGLRILKIHPLKFDFQSSATGQTIRFPYFELEVEGGDFFDSTTFTNGENKTFVELYKDGSLFFFGYLSFSLISKTEYYLDSSGNLKYRKVRLRIYDALQYYNDNDINLTEIGYSDEQSIQTTIGQIIGYLSSSITINYTTKNIIEEKCGLNYNLSEIKTKGLDTGTQVRKFIYYVTHFMALNIVNWNGEYYVLARQGESSYQTLDSDKFLKITKLRSSEIVNYVKVSATKDWTLIDGYHYGETTHTKENGSSYSKQSSQITIDASDFFPYLFVNYKGSDTNPWPSPAVQPDDIDADGEWVDKAGIDAYTNQIETGMELTAMHQTSGNEIYAPLNDLDYSWSDDYGDYRSRFYFPGTKPSAYDDDQYFFSITKAYNTGSGVDTTLYKIQKMVEYLADTLWDLFSSPSRLQIKYYEISDLDITKKINLGSITKPIRSITADFMKNTITITLF